MIDIVYLAKGRPEFTEASLPALVANTNWAHARLLVYTDGDICAMDADFIDRREHGGPVGVMNAYLAAGGSNSIFAKIDNDVIVPPGWLDAALVVMCRHPGLGLLGIEPPASRTAAPWANGARPEPPEHAAVKIGWPENEYGYAPCDSIGGIGLMRRSAFACPDAMRPHAIYGGFTDWQLRHPEVRKGWIVPPLNVFLLDRLPIEPWASLSREYLRRGEQRPWTNYTAADAHLWDWWQPAAVGGDALAGVGLSGGLA